MNFGFMLFFNSILLGVGLAMDAFSISLANGLNDPDMKRHKMCEIAGVFGFFQALMPMTGWVCVHTVVTHFKSFEKIVPWIALVLLLFIGGKMLIGGIKKTESETQCEKLGFLTLMVQGIATSIDALSVGFTISEYNLLTALLCSLIIATVTFFVCLAGLMIGKKFGVALSDKAGILGGSILIFIGLEIFIKSLL